jgi:molybdopterin-guanine dinucleotide biosynthesis protein A
MSERASSTLVVFTLGARTDARRRPVLGPSASGLELGLRRACLDSAFEAGRRAGLRLAVCSPEPLAEAPADARWLRQQRGTFGERFEAAVEHGLGATKEPLVIVGGDVPGLTASLLETALEGLARDPEAVVVGPARDGGFYLLASARPLGPVLREVRWCGRDTRQSLLKALARAGRPVVLLPPLRDLDRPADVEGWLAEGRPQAASVHLWSDRLRRFLSARRRPSASRDARLPSRESSGSILGRAPPLLAFS